MKELKDPVTRQVPKDVAREWHEIWKKDQGGYFDPKIAEILIPWWATPSDLACSDIDCNHDGIPDFLQKDRCR